jgi:GNAT superfamily N-acetyltransferase
MSPIRPYRGRGHGQGRPELRARVINPARFERRMRSTFADQLWEVHDEIFEGTTREDFDHYVFPPHAARTRIRVLAEQPEDRFVGYSAVHRYDHALDGRTVSVFRNEVGVLPQYRGQGGSMMMMASEALRFKLRYPFRDGFLLATLVHPSSYRMIASAAHQMYPNPDRAPVPDHMESLMQSAAASFGVKRIYPDDPVRSLIVNCGWVTRETIRKGRGWEHPHSVYFRELNPGYTEGHGLLTLVPGDANNLLRSFVPYAWKVAMRPFRGLSSGNS